MRMTWTNLCVFRAHNRDSGRQQLDLNRHSRYQAWVLHGFPDGLNGPLDCRPLPFGVLYPWMTLT